MKKWIVLFCIVFSGCGVEHVTTEKGLECVIIQGACGNGVSCNWEAYNVKTNYGEYPYAKEEKIK